MSDSTPPGDRHPTPYVIVEAAVKYIDCRVDIGRAIADHVIQTLGRLPECTFVGILFTNNRLSMV